MSEIQFICEKCGNKIKTSVGIKPECCGQLMKQIPLNICNEPVHAESARTINSDEPCDDGRAG